MNIEARRKWLKWRRGGLGGSDVAGVLNLSPWSSPFSVWWSKVRDQEEEDSPVLKRGKLLEEAILQWAGGELGGLVRGSPVVHPEFEWARGTPDGWTDVDEGLEAKTVRFFDPEYGWGPDGSNEVPLHYRIQCLWYMTVTEAKVWRLAAFATIQDEWRIFTIEPDEEVQSRLLEVAGKFWKEHVLDDVAPALDSSPAASAYLRERFPVSKFDVVEATEEDLELLEAYSEARDQERRAKKTKDELAVRIKERIGDSKGLQGEPGELKATWSRFDRTKTDWKKLQEENPHLDDLVSSYTRTTPSDRLNLTRRKNAQ